MDDAVDVGEGTHQSGTSFLRAALNARIHAFPFRRPCSGPVVGIRNDVREEDLSLGRFRTRWAVTEQKVSRRSSLRSVRILGDATHCSKLWCRELAIPVPCFRAPKAALLRAETPMGLNIHYSLIEIP